MPTMTFQPKFMKQKMMKRYLIVRLTHFVQGRSPLNPFPEGPPQRKVPENLCRATARQVIHHTTCSTLLEFLERELP